MEVLAGLEEAVAPEELVGAAAGGMAASVVALEIRVEAPAAAPAEAAEMFPLAGAMPMAEVPAAGATAAKADLRELEAAKPAVATLPAAA
jgi:hypothetical protein